MKISTLLLIIGFTLLVGCHSDPLPKGAIKKAVFIDVLVDIHLAEGIIEESALLDMDSLKSVALYLTVLKKYNITEEQMLKTTLYYSRNQKDYDKIFSEVLSKINAMTEEENVLQIPVVQKVK